MKIDRIYMTTYRRDLRQTRICIGSIRYFYPDIPIHLLINEELGPMPEREFANAWGVRRHPTPSRMFRDTLSQFEPFFTEPGIRFFLMDTDIVFAGRVLDLFEPHEEEMVVMREFATDDSRDLHWIRMAKLAEIDPGFRYPGWVFNSGQWAGTSGLFAREELRPWVTDEEVPRVRHPEVFYKSQGLLNYLAMKKAAAGKLTVGYQDLALWGGLAEPMAKVSLEEIKQRKHPPLLIHWAGVKKPRVEELPRFDILDFFEKYYYSRIPSGAVKKWWDFRYEPLSLDIRRATRNVRRRLDPKKTVG